uniref:Centrosomal protein CEP104 N-terminal domain-containing protein n=1 Tax=Plectus sambesii TaxID=2011161 RepID=A0A914WDQ6_9BILA
MAWTHRKDLKLADPVPYKCAFVSSQVNTVEAVLTDSLKTSGPGWLSGPNPDFPQAVVLDMVYLANVVKIQVTPHKTCRPESIEVWSSRAEDRNDKKYKSLGVIVFKETIDRRPPDPKPLFVDTLAKWLWFQVGPPKTYSTNAKQQVGIDEIQVFGYYDKPPTPPPPEDPKDRR